MKEPDSKNWNIWVGHEIEGYTDLAVLTIFIRYTPGPLDFSLIKELAMEKLIEDFHPALFEQEIQRVWFCKEFLMYADANEQIQEASKHFRTVCVETDYFHNALSDWVRQNAKLYFKLDVELKEGDHICVGRAYRDECFQIGRGKRVTPEEYSQDLKIA